MKLIDFYRKNMQFMAETAYKLFSENHVLEAMIYMAYANELGKEIEKLQTPTSAKYLSDIAGMFCGDSDVDKERIW